MSWLGKIDVAFAFFTRPCRWVRRALVGFANQVSGFDHRQHLHVWIEIFEWIPLLVESKSIAAFFKTWKFFIDHLVGDDLLSDMRNKLAAQEADERLWPIFRIFGRVNVSQNTSRRILCRFLPSQTVLFSSFRHCRLVVRFF